MADSVSRIRLFRALQSHYPCNHKEVIKLFLSDEFNQPILISLLSSITISYLFIEKSQIKDIREYLHGYHHDHQIVVQDKKCTKDGYCSFLVSFPSIIGQYTLVITASASPLTLSSSSSSSSSSSTIVAPSSTTTNLFNSTILSFMSDWMDIVSIIVFPSERLIFHPQFTCYRIFHSYHSHKMNKTGNIDATNDTINTNEYSSSSLSLLNTFLIKEDYGSNLGSHIYDSSVILLDYLNLHWNHHFTSNKRRLCLELGSGCGLISIWLSQFFHHIICSDKLCQLNLLEENRKENNILEENLSIVEIDWSNNDHIHRIKDIGLDKGKGKIDFIIAADIFYDLDAVSYYYKVLRNILTWNEEKCMIIVAQKIRIVPLKGNDDGNNDNLINQNKIDLKLQFQLKCELEGFQSVELYEKGMVVIWQIEQP